MTLTYEQWREKSIWYGVMKPEADEPPHSDASVTYRLANCAALEAWNAAIASAEQQSPSPSTAGDTK